MHQSKTSLPLTRGQEDPLRSKAMSTLGTALAIFLSVGTMMVLVALALKYVLK